MNRKIRERVVRYLTASEKLKEQGYYPTGYIFKTGMTRFCTGFDPEKECWNPFAEKKIAMVDMDGNIEYLDRENEK